MEYIPSFRDQLQNGSEPSWRNELDSELYHYGVKGMKWDPSKLTGNSNSGTSNGGTWFDLIRKKQLQNSIQALKQKAAQRKNGVVATATKTNSVSSKAPASSNQVSSKAPTNTQNKTTTRVLSKKVSDAVKKSMNADRAQYISKHGPAAFENKASNVRMISNPYYDPNAEEKTEDEWLAELKKDRSGFMAKYGPNAKKSQVRATNKRIN
jgi:hypothetical protein